MRDDLKQLAENWPHDIPFERAVRLKLSALLKLRQEGLTWKTIARALTGAGVRKRNGALMSARQMNTVMLRVWKFASIAVDDCDPAPSVLSPAPSLAPARATTADGPRHYVGPVEQAVFPHQRDSSVSVGSPTDHDLARRLSEARRMSGRRRSSFEE
jgi:hypothetical protein